MKKPKPYVIKVLERDVRRAIYDLLRAFKIEYKPIYAGLGNKGLPDITIFVNRGPYKGHWIPCEVKRPGGKLRKDQREFIRMCDDADIPYIVADDPMDVAYFLELPAYEQGSLFGSSIKREVERMRKAHGKDKGN